MRKGYKAIKEDVDDFLYWLHHNSEKEMRSSREMVLCILRLITQTDFKTDIEELRKSIKLPPKELFDKNPTYNYRDWIEEHAEAPSRYTDRAIEGLCKKYKLDVARYQEFVWNYLYYGGIHPLLPIDMWHSTTPDEARYKARLEFLNGGKEMPKAGYIRFYQDTTMHQLGEFINANKEIIKTFQKGLTKYPTKYSHNMGTFKQHLSVYLLYLQGNTDTEIRDMAEEKLQLKVDEDRVRKIISEMKKLIAESGTSDIFSLEDIDNIKTKANHRTPFNKV